MRRFQGKFFLACFVSVFLILNASCATLPRFQSSSEYSDSTAGEFFFSPAPDFGSPTFISRWTREVSERDKIFYLLERIGSSENRFIRNGRTYDGRKARLWLSYKLRHWVRGVQTAEDFVGRVASHSQKTGRPYLVESQDGKRYPLQHVLGNELTAFEKHRLPVFKTPAESLIEKAAPVSLPAVLATRTSE